MRYLGIDYGTKRIGLAVSNEYANMAFPFLVIKNDKDLIKNLSEIIKAEKIKEVVIGDSKNYQMLDNEIMEEVKDLIQILEKEVGVDVSTHSEILSSSMAEKVQGKNEMLDASAATIILQSYLDLRNYQKNKI